MHVIDAGMQDAYLGLVVSHNHMCKVGQNHIYTVYIR